MKGISIPKRHHYIAIMHQKKFADQDGCLFCFDRDAAEKKVEKRLPNNLFVEGHLYTQKDQNGEKDVSLERHLSRLEGDVSPIIGKIICAARSGDYGSIKATDIDIWLNYFYFQIRRTPDSLKDALRNFDPDENLDEVIAEAKVKFPKQVDKITKIDNSADRKRIIKNATVVAISQGSSTVLNILTNRGIAVARIMIPGTSFILGSHPVVRMESNDIRDLKTELWLPIAPDVAVGLGHGDAKILPLSILDKAAVRRMNVAAVSQSRVIAGNSRYLISSLAKSFGYKVT
jgi:Protein of unknown function (DUF4238)